MAGRRLACGVVLVVGLSAVAVPVGAQAADTPSANGVLGERPLAPPGWAAPAGAVPQVESVAVDASAPAPGAARAFGLARAGSVGASESATVVARATGLAPFAVAGVSTTGGGHLHAQLRVHRSDGSWSAWQELEAAGAEETGESGRAGSEPVWVGRADGYELALAGPGASADDVQLHLVRLEAPAAGAAGAAGQVTAAATAATASPASALALGPAGIPADSQPPLWSGRQAPPAIYGRPGWGARPVDGVDVAKEVRVAVVHHTADGAPYGYGPGDVPGMLRAIQAYHQDALGWWDIGYNFVVDRFGRTWEGRTGGLSKAVIGAHAGGFNTATVGVAVLGDFRGAGVDPAIFEGLTQIIAWKLFLSGAHPATPATLVSRAGGDRFGPGSVVPMPRIVGHGDLNVTSCPAGLSARLGELLGAVQARYAGFSGGVDLAAVATPATPAGAEAHDGDFNGDGRRDVLWDTVDSDRLIWFGQADGSVAPMPIDADARLEPLVGDFDGEGTSDVFWHGPEGSAAVWYERFTGLPRQVLQPPASHSRGVAYDGDGDGDDDIVWYDPDSGAAAVWLSLGPAGFRAVLAAQEPGGRPVVLDADGDGRDEVLWYRPGQQVHNLWRSGNDISRTAAFPVVLNGSGEPAVGDFDGDDRDDVVLAGPAGSTVNWLSLNASSDLGVAGELTPVAGDIGGGGPDELLLVNQAAGLMGRFVGSGDRGLGGALLPVPAGLRPLMADVNGDARADVRWLSPSGANELWLAA